MRLPTIDQLNELPADQVSLLLLRALNTSDLAHYYMLLKAATITDIVDQAKGILAIASESNSHGLSAEELIEFERLCNNLIEYATKFPDP